MTNRYLHFRLGKEIKELELKLNEYVKNKETETSNKYEHENKDKDRSLSNDHRSASKDHKNDERKSRDISHDKDKHVRSKDHSSRRKSRSASKGNRRSSRSQDHRRPSDRFDSKQSGKRRSNERKSDDRGSNSKDDLRYELEICKSNRRNNDERLNRSRHARDSRTKSPVFKLVRSPRKSASPRRISSSSKKISASNLVFPDGNSRRNSAGSDSGRNSYLSHRRYYRQLSADIKLNKKIISLKLGLLVLRDRRLRLTKLVLILLCVENCLQYDHHNVMIFQFG